MWYNNQLTQSLNIQYPIIQAGMAGSTTAELVATVSNKGGLGCIERATLLQKVRARNSKVRINITTICVNLFVPSHQSYTNEQVEHMNAWLKPYRKH